MWSKTGSIKLMYMATSLICKQGTKFGRCGTLKVHFNINAYNTVNIKNIIVLNGKFLKKIAYSISASGYVNRDTFCDVKLLFLRFYSTCFIVRLLQGKRGISSTEQVNIHIN